MDPVALTSLYRPFEINDLNTYYFLLSEFLDLTLCDVGRYIELVYIPTRKDGVKGRATSILSNVIAPGEFNSLFLVLRMHNDMFYVRTWGIFIKFKVLRSIILHLCYMDSDKIV